jgi:hypothetical protein
MGIEQPLTVSVQYCCKIEIWDITGVPFLKNCPRAPLGPSVVLIDGMPRCGRGTVLQKSAPANSDTCSKSAVFVICKNIYCICKKICGKSQLRVIEASHTIPALLLALAYLKQLRHGRKYGK